ncbi:MAG: type II toxin-antitoxin system PemK/MazF family toxin [Planctomycetaceae bacterium]|nr:type II toxin-antitoxin system PemK/MazF family toxin [Planctomycetaceae bacterium]
MNYRRWEIVFLRTDDKDRDGHPAVVLSSDDVMADDRQQRFNVVTGTKKQPAEQARHHHVILDGADGLEFATFVDCSLVYVARKTSILRSSGRVTVHRRQQIQRGIRGYLGLG